MKRFDELTKDYLLYVLIGVRKGFMSWSDDKEELVREMERAREKDRELEEMGVPGDRFCVNADQEVQRRADQEVQRS